MKNIIYILLFLGSLYLSNSQVSTIISVTGIVTDAIDKKPLKLNLVFKDKDENIVFRTKSNEATNGSYFATGLKPGMKYIISINGTGYFAEDFELEIPSSDKYLELSKDFTVKPMQIGTEIPITIAPFDVTKSKLRNGSDYIFESLTNVMKKNPKAKFELVCFPDSDNDKEINKKLTFERCDVLKKYFLDKGIPSIRFEVKNNESVDPKNPPPVNKAAKGKRYLGSIYLVIKSV
jgi:outer membrane protein OmpA-like peptidoglycan-associated protein